MENKKTIKIISIIAVILVVFVGLFLSFYIYSFLTVSSEYKDVKLEKIEINSDLYNKVKDIPSYGTKVTSEEPGFGRDNPFSPYKQYASDTPEEGPTTIIIEDQDATAAETAESE